MDNEQLLPEGSPRSRKEERIAFKVIVVGESQVGKTCLINRYLVGEFTSNFKSTVGVDFGLKVLERDGKKMVIQLWDIAGQERFINMTRVYYVQAKGGFVVYDVTNPLTKESAIKWKIDIDQKCTNENGKHIPVYLLVNKIDLVPSGSSWEGKAEIDTFCKEHGFRGYFETSAKENIGISDAVLALLQVMIDDSSALEVPEQEVAPSNTIQLVDQPVKNETNSCQC